MSAGSNPAGGTRTQPAKSFAEQSMHPKRRPCWFRHCASPEATCRRYLCPSGTRECSPRGAGAGRRARATQLRMPGRAVGALADTRVVVINGARQTGESTLARLVAAEFPGSELRYLDEAPVRAAAQADPGLFVRHDALLVIDEVPTTWGTGLYRPPSGPARPAFARQADGPDSGAPACRATRG